MKSVHHIHGTLALLDRANVDTDQIIPKQFLKSIKRTGFGDNLFDGWRFLDEGDIGKTPNERRLNASFELNHAAYQGANVLVARRNFGCGSSREHAVWALMEYGFECVLAPSFADIFFNNSVKNGLLLITLAEDAIDALFERARETSTGVEISLETMTLAIGDAPPVAFELDPHVRRRLMEGLDDIGITLAQADDIRAYEARQRMRRPWLFREEGSDKGEGL